MERTQHDFPALIPFLAVLSLAIPAAAAEPPSGREVALNLRQNTVRIEAQKETKDHGFGFIVGEKQGALYAVTADHVVEQKDPDAPPPKIRVELFENQGEMIEATVLKHDHDHDLAVLTFPAPAGFHWNRRALGLEKDQNVSTEVWFVGKSAAWTVPVAAARISSDKPADSRIDIEGSSIIPGTSGAPLIAPSGIVGMVVTDSEGGAKALSIAFIREELEGWRQPWNLENTDPRDVYAARGEKIAKSDPLSAALREQQPEGPTRWGFDLGMADAENQTAWGPGKQARLDSLPSAEQAGYKAATSFSLDRNKYADRARIGAKIAEADALVALTRKREPDARYWLGFDIATGIFGDPKLGAQGNTAFGPGAKGIRDSLSPPAQRGFDAAVALHLSRKY